MNKLESLASVSVIVPVRNEYSNIADVLDKLLLQSYPMNKMEILCIDGLSTDGTREIIKQFKNKSLPVIRLIDNPKGQRASALNIGIKEAKGDVIIRVDARTIIPPDYIEKCVRTLLETRADNVGGMQKPVIRGLGIVDRKSLLTQMAIGMALSNAFGVGNAKFRVGKKNGYVDTVYPGCFRREVFDKVGLFDEDSVVISEDADMNYRIRQAGGKVYLNRDIVVYYYPRDNFRDLWKLYFRYGGAKAGNLIKRGRLTAWRQFVPPTFLLSLILLPICGIVSKFFFYLWFLICGSYIATDFIVSLHLTFKHQISDLLPPDFLSEVVNQKSEDKNPVYNIRHSKPFLFGRLLLVFPTMHFSWAMGFWRRLLQRPKPGEYWGG